MEDPAYTLHQIYESSGSVTVTIKTGPLPPTPDKCVAFTDTGGRAPSNSLDTSEVSIQHPSVQARIRGNPQSYTDTRNLVEDVYDTLHKKMRQTVSGVEWEQILAKGEPIWLGLDENDRPEWSVNFEIMK